MTAAAVYLALILCTPYGECEHWEIPMPERTTMHLCVMGLGLRVADAFAARHQRVVGSWSCEKGPSA